MSRCPLADDVGLKGWLRQEGLEPPMLVHTWSTRGPQTREIQGDSRRRRVTFREGVRNERKPLRYLRFRSVRKGSTWWALLDLNQ